MDNSLPELDHIIFEFLQITDLINLLLTNKKYVNIIKQENRYKKYQEFYKKYQEVYKKEYNIFISKLGPIIIDYFCEGCRYGDTEIIKYFINKYKLSSFYNIGFKIICIYRDPEMVEWYFNNILQNKLLNFSRIDYLNFKFENLNKLSILTNQKKNKNLIEDKCNLPDITFTILKSNWDLTIKLCQECKSKNIVIDMNDILSTVVFCTRKACDLVTKFLQYHNFDNNFLKDLANNINSERCHYKTLLSDLPLNLEEKLLSICQFDCCKKNQDLSQIKEIIEKIKNKQSGFSFLLEQFHYIIDNGSYELVIILCNNIDFSKGEIEYIFRNLFQFRNREKLEFLFLKYDLNFNDIYDYIDQDTSIWFYEKYKPDIAYDLWLKIIFSNNVELLKSIGDIGYFANFSFKYQGLQPDIIVILYNFKRIPKNILYEFLKWEKNFSVDLLKLALSINFNLDNKIQEIFNRACNHSLELSKIIYENYKNKINMNDNIKIWLGIKN